MNAVALAELLGHAFGKVIANDAARSSFTVTAGKRLLAVDGANLSVVHAWPLEVGAPGWHASLPDEGLALVSGSDRAVTVDPGGHVQELDCGPGMLVPASDSWLTVEPTRVRRWTLA